MYLKMQINKQINKQINAMKVTYKQKNNYLNDNDNEI